jgi:hypothetical protein
MHRNGHGCGWARPKADQTRLSHDIAEVAESVGALASHIDKRFDEIQPVLDRVENHDRRLRFVEDRVTELAKK